MSNDGKDGGDTLNVSSTNQSGGITAGKVVLTQQDDKPSTGFRSQIWKRSDGRYFVEVKTIDGYQLNWCLGAPKSHPFTLYTGSPGPDSLDNLNGGLGNHVTIDQEVDGTPFHFEGCGGPQMVLNSKQHAFMAFDGPPPTEIWLGFGASPTQLTGGITHLKPVD